LARAAGVAMPDAMFPPFARGFFDSAGGADEAYDRVMMCCALCLAADGMGKTGDNPVVGCVIVDESDGILSEARTGDGGRPHAEEQAVAQAGARARGATAYVTLEPCNQRSAGGVSCTDLLIQAGVARIVISTRDPHPLANGKGVERLQN